MQSSLPDVNSAVVRYRILIISQLERYNYTGAVGSLYSLNACLPSEYRVAVSNEKYNELIKQRYSIFCSNCNKESDLDTVKVHKVVLSMFDSFVSGLKEDEVWSCPNLECKHINRLAKSRVRVTKLDSNTYIQVMPEPPNRTEGMMGRTRYHNEISKWVWRFLNELEERLSRFRQEYIPLDQQTLGDIPEE